MPYKFSQFNSLLPYQQHYALYNSFTQKVIFLESFLKDLLEAAVHEGVDQLESYHPEFYRYLIQEGYLIPEDTDEVEKVKELVRQVDEDESIFLLTINPTLNCNFTCWYCYETHLKQSRLTPESIEKINKLITRIASRPKLRNFNLSFFGGEPLLYFKKQVVPIIEHFYQTCERQNKQYGISFTTNGYLIDEDFIRFFEERNLRCSLQITLDGHRQHHDTVRFVHAQKGSYDEIIRNIHLLVNHGFFVRVRVNFTAKNLGECYRIADDLCDLDRTLSDTFMLVDFHRVWQDNEGGDLFDLLQHTLQYFRNKGLKVENRYSPNNVLNSCYADKRNSAVVNYDGNLFKCTARDFAKVHREGYVNEDGELVWENHSLEKRMQAKFHNPPCLKCRLLPLCNGGCSQHALEALEEGRPYCVYNGDEYEKDRVIIQKIQEIVEAHALAQTE
ncbi:MAG: radical SAM protein [Thermoflavifilum aggregans]|nr:radical SAM protein [Thermoflavifilum aggregans]